LITRIYRKLKNLCPTKKWANELNRVFLQEEVQMAKITHEKKCSSSLVIKKM
jgi:hypothetical protein